MSVHHTTWNIGIIESPCHYWSAFVNKVLNTFTYCLIDAKHKSKCRTYTAILDTKIKTILHHVWKINDQSLIWPKYVVCPAVTCTFSECSRVPSVMYIFLLSVTTVQVMDFPVTESHKKSLFNRSNLYLSVNTNYLTCRWWTPIKRILSKAEDVI